MSERVLDLSSLDLGECPLTLDVIYDRLRGAQEQGYDPAYLLLSSEGKAQFFGLVASAKRYAVPSGDESNEVQFHGLTMGTAAEIIEKLELERKAAEREANQLSGLLTAAKIVLESA